MVELDRQSRGIARFALSCAATAKTRSGRTGFELDRPIPGKVSLYQLSCTPASRKPSLSDANTMCYRALKTWAETEVRNPSTLYPPARYRSLPTGGYSRIQSLCCFLVRTCIALQVRENIDGKRVSNRRPMPGRNIALHQLSYSRIQKLSAFDANLYCLCRF